METTNLQRHAPEMPFPQYAYVPRMFPHPTRDPEGHSHGREETPGAALTRENWRETPLHLYGIDLFNHGYYWEAHEAWETLWHAGGRRGTIGDLLKALIKLAAAGVKAREGNANGVRRAANRAVQLIDTVAASSPNACAGIDLERLRQHAARIVSEPDRHLNTIGAPAVVVFDFTLPISQDRTQPSS